jgi:hypothetical protein
MINGSARQDLPGIIEASVIKINPYVETYFTRVPYNETGQTLSVVRFSVADEHAYLGHNNNPSDFITKKGTSGLGRYNQYR